MTLPNLTKVKRLAIDIESKDPNLKELGPGCRRGDSYILGVSIATNDKSWYFTLKHLEEDLKTPHKDNIDNEKFFKWLIDLNDKEFLLANCMYDLDHFQYRGFIPTGKILDVQIAEPLINENAATYSLDSLAEKYLGLHKEKEDTEIWCKDRKLKGDHRQYLWMMPPELVGRYAKADAELTYKVFEKQWPIIVEQELVDVFNLECDLIPMLLQMKRVGVRFDVNKRAVLDKQYFNKIQINQQSINDIAGMEVNTNAAASIALAFDKLGYGYEFTDKGAPCFDADHLTLYGNSLSSLILEGRHLRKTYTTYISGMEKFIVKGRIHPDFNALRSDEYGTVTGRLSGSKPNLQNQPKPEDDKENSIGKDIRSLFLPEENCSWVKMDYCQEEMVLFAHFAMGGGAEQLREMYRNDPKADMYKIFAALALRKKVEEVTKEDRKLFKTISLGVLYGMGTDKLGRKLGLITEDQVSAEITKQYWDNKFSNQSSFFKIDDRHMSYMRQYIKAWEIMHEMHCKLPCLKETTKKCSETMQKRGYVKTILGRRRRLDDFYYRAFNSVDQGSGGDIMKKGMVDCYKAGIFNVLLPHLTCHDELDVSIPETKEGIEAAREMKHIMEHCIELKVPLRVNVEKGKNWGELEKWEI